MISYEMLMLVAAFVVTLCVAWFFIYVSVKLAAFAWCKGRQVFFDKQRKESSDGDDETEA